MTAACTFVGFLVGWMVSGWMAERRARFVRYWCANCGVYRFNRPCRRCHP